MKSGPHSSSANILFFAFWKTNDGEGRSWYRPFCHSISMFLFYYVPLCLPPCPLFSIFYGLLTLLLPWNNKHVSWGGNRWRSPTQKNNYIARKDGMKGGSVTHAHTPLKHGWLVLRVGKSVRVVKVMVYLFLTLSPLFFPHLYFLFGPQTHFSFSIDKILQNGLLWQSHASRTFKTFPTDDAAYWIWHYTWQPLWGSCEVARLCHDWPTALTYSVYLRSCDYKVTRPS